MKTIARLSKSAGVYLAGSALSKLIAFLMLPLYTAAIGPAAYGAYDAGLAYASFFGSVLYLDIWNGILRFMYDYNNGAEKLRPAAAGSVLFAASSALFCFSLLGLSFVLPLSHVGLLCLYGVAQNLQQAAGSVARGLGRSVRYIVAGVTGAACTAATGFWLLRAGMGVEALYLSSGAGFLVAAAIHLTAIPRVPRQNLRPDKALLRKLLAFSAPLSLNSIAYWFLTAYNRTAISRLLTDYDNGLYAVAGKFGMALMLLTQCVQLAWQELAFGRGAAQPEASGVFFARAANIFFAALGLAFAALLPIVRLVFPYMADAAYAGAMDIIPAYLLAMLLSAACSFLASIFGALKQTNALFVNMALGAIVNVVCLHRLIGPLGVKAAALSMGLGFGVNACAHLVRLRRVLPGFRWPLWGMAVCGGLTWLVLLFF